MNLTKNLSLKLISLVIAVFLWFTVTSKEYRYSDFNIPLELLGLPENLVVTGTTYDGQTVNNVTARVRASEALIRSLGERAMFLQVNIDGMGAGSHTVQLTDDMVMGRPPGAEITEIFPRVVDIEIEQLLIRPDVVVNPEILGKPADNFDIALIVSDPPIVRVSGPKSIVEKIEMIRTQQVNVDGLKNMNLDRQVRLVPPHPMVHILPESVNLRIRIDEKAVSKKFEKVDVNIKGAKFQTTINPEKLDVWVQGPISQIDRIKSKNLSAFIQLTGKEPHGNNIKMDPQLEIVSSDSFPGIKLERFSQSYVDVLVSSRRLD